MNRKNDNNNNNLLLVGAGLLSLVIGAGATYFMNQQGNGSARKSISGMNPSPLKKPCGCGKR